MQNISNMDDGSKVHYASPVNISDPILLNENVPICVFSNDIILDSIYSMYTQYMTNSSVNGVVQVFPLIMELRTIDEAYYHYLKSLYLYERGRFDSYIGEVFPLYPVYFNVPNGYGITSAFSSCTFDTIYPSN